MEFCKIDSRKEKLQERVDEWMTSMVRKMKEAESNATSTSEAVTVVTPTTSLKRRKKSSVKNG
jgi:hypothetical protein